MKAIFGLANFKKLKKRTVIIIGVFDGLHRGHRYLMRKAVIYAKRLNLPTLCLTFDPHPRHLPYLISLEHRLKLIEELGVDYCVVVKFNKKFARISSKDFVGKILVKLFNPRIIFVGKDFRFGRNAEGDTAYLKSLAAKFDFVVHAVNELKINRQKISSNLIRSLIKKGNIKYAGELLGRRVSVLGTVIKGFKRGRILGFPTANINPHHEILPVSGVYAVKIMYPIGSYRSGKRRYHALRYNGICNIGTRPTFYRSLNCMQTIEVHIFNFNKNIYGENIEINFIRYIRPEKRFPSANLLIAQIAKDKLIAKEILKHTPD